jgi:hydrogenase small subunit
MKELHLNPLLKKLNTISRRDFLKFCTITAASLGLPLETAPKIAAAITNPKRPPVIWLAGQACTGCTEALLRPTHPTLEHLLLDLISLDYNETLNAGAGNQAESYLEQSIHENHKKFILVVEGAIPTKDGGVYCMIAGRPFKDIVAEVAPKAAAVLSMGSCASWGGIPSAEPNPTGAVSAPELLQGKDIPIVNIPGCPPNGHNILQTIVYFLTFNKLPELDEHRRPTFAYGRLIHENCERRPHFDAGRFALRFGDEGHRKGYCLYKLGCKGPETYANCPAILFNEVGPGAWPVGTGFPCFGCTQQGVGFFKPVFSHAELQLITPSSADLPPITPEREKAISPGAAALVAGLAGAAAGAGAMALKKIGATDDVHDHERSEGE